MSINILFNPLTTIGSYTTHENSPGNSPDFVTPASRFGWPARSRHAVACMHRFSHILRASCVPAVWIMPEWRAVDRAETRKYEDLPIISSSSEIAAVVRGLYNALSVMLNNPLTTIGSYTTHENSPGNSPDFVTPASRFGWPARSRHAVACMHRFSHILRASCVPAVWIMPEWRAVDRAETRKYEDLPIISSSSEIAAVVRGLYNALSVMLNNPLTTIGSYTTHENSPGNSPDFVTPASRFGWPARSRHAVACMHRFSHILRASCVPAVWIMPEWRAVDRAETRKYEDLPIISSSSEIAAVVRGLYNALSVMLNNPLTTIGSYTTHENSPGNSPDFVTPASRFGWPARSRHAVACMHRFSHILRASCVPAVWIMPEWRAVDRAETRKYEDLPIISSSSEIAAVVRGLRETYKPYVALYTSIQDGLEPPDNFHISKPGWLGAKLL